MSALHPAAPGQHWPASCSPESRFAPTSEQGGCNVEAPTPRGLARHLAAGGCRGSIGGDKGSGPIAGNTDPPGGPAKPTPPPPYEAISARAYASKVKDLLTGLPLEDAELQAVTPTRRRCAASSTPG
jgi:hypothetical protein